MLDNLKEQKCIKNSRLALKYKMAIKTKNFLIFIDCSGKNFPKDPNHTFPRPWSAVPHAKVCAAKRPTQLKLGVGKTRGII